MVDNWCIYALKDPRTFEVRYIGKTVHLATRLREHLSKAKREGRNTHQVHWLNQLLEQGIEPVVEGLERGEGESWKTAEQEWIKRYKAAGAQLTNATDGGEGTTGLVVELSKVCQGCGITFLAHSIKAKYCDLCCTFDCIECGKTFRTRVYSRKHHPPLYCSSECYGKGKLPSWKVCARCGKDFTSTSGNALYCKRCRI